jgi:hypothetical protein
MIVATAFLLDLVHLQLKHLRRVVAVTGQIV